MARQIINTGTVPNDGTGDPLRTALTKTNENFEEIYPITESVTKTVAADGDPAGVMDFDDFHTAMTWACGQLVTGTSLTLSLEDGVHYVGPPSSIDPEFDSFYIITNGNYIKLKSTSGNRDNCTITLQDEVTPSWGTNIQVRNGAKIDCQELTIDLMLGGLSNGNTINAFMARNAANIRINDCVIINAASPFTLNYNSYCTVLDTKIDACPWSAFCFYDSYTTLTDSEVTNCGSVCFSCKVGSVVTIVGTFDYTGTTSIASFPINQIQPDGSYITDGTVPLMLSGSAGTTAERPDPVMDGFNYFDTTLGKPIWYDGTNWVDATGATV